MEEPSTEEMVEVAKIWNKVPMKQRVKIMERFKFEDYGAIFYNDEVRNYLLSLGRRDMKYV